MSKAYKLQSYGSQPVCVEEQVPDASGSEIILKVSHAGVCHSDVYIMDGYQDLGDGEKMEFSESAMPMPLTMGHEVVGEVVSVGSEVDRELVGKRRLIYPWIGCGNCVSCAAGQDNHCEDPQTLGIFRDGGYADYICVPESKYLIDIDGLDPAWACTLACSGLTVYSAFKQIEPIKPNSSIAIIGMGGLGLTAVSVGKALGIDNIIACDISKDRLDEAVRLGATATLDSAKSNVSLSEIAEGKLYGIIDTVGNPSTVSMGIEQCMKGGRVVLVGLQGGKIPLAIPTLPFKALSLVGTYTGTLQELKELVVLAKTEGLDQMPIEQRPMRCVHETLEQLRRGEILGRVVLEPGE